MQRGRLRRIRVLIAASLVAAAATLPQPARAAACCTSAASFGVGRLLVWEDWAVGLQLSHARSLETAVVTKFISSLNFVSAPRVGLNPVIVTLHRMDGAMVFTGVDDATLVLDPQMPSMGHGSPGSVNPTITAVSGVYEGQLSFSMAGAWETTLTVSIPGFSPPATPKFTTTF